MPRNGRPKVALELTPEEKASLMRQGQQRRLGRAASLRARVILACSEGRNNREVARLFELAEHTVGKWRRRFVVARMAGLQDRRGQVRHRPLQRTTQHAAKLCELALALSQRAPFGPWSLGQALISTVNATAADGRKFAHVN